MSMFDSMRAWAHRVKRDGVTLWFAHRHPDTPFGVKVLCVFLVAYALSPIDLIPDFIPVLGYVDDVILLPVLIWLAIRPLPPAVVQPSRLRADAWMAEHYAKPKSKASIVLVVAIWIAVLYLLWYWFAS